MKKRLTALVLTLLMVLALTPAAVFAAETTLLSEITIEIPESNGTQFTFTNVCDEFGGEYGELDYGLSFYFGANATIICNKDVYLYEINATDGYSKEGGYIQVYHYYTHVYDSEAAKLVETYKAGMPIPFSSLLVAIKGRTDYPTFVLQKEGKDYGRQLYLHPESELVDIVRNGSFVYGLFSIDDLEVKEASDLRSITKLDKVIIPLANGEKTVNMTLTNVADKLFFNYSMRVFADDLEFFFYPGATISFDKDMLFWEDFEDEYLKEIKAGEKINIDEVYGANPVWEYSAVYDYDMNSYACLGVSAAGFYPLMFDEYSDMGLIIGMSDEIGYKLINTMELASSEPKASDTKASIQPSALGNIITWSPADNTGGYHIYRATDKDAWTCITSKPVHGGSFVDINVQSNTKYTYVVLPIGQNADGTYDDRPKSGDAVEKAIADGMLAEIEITTGEITEVGDGAKSYILMQLDNPMMQVNGEQQEVDPGRGTTPVTKDNRTLVPIRAIVEAMGGVAGWNAAAQKVTLDALGHNVVMQLGSKAIVTDGVTGAMDIAPEIVNARTLLPIRFAAEELGAKVAWVGSTREIVIVWVVE